MKRHVVILFFLSVGLRLVTPVPLHSTLSDQSLNPLILISPEYPQPGQIFRVIQADANEKNLFKLQLIGPSGAIKTNDKKQGGGPPFWQVVTFHSGAAGDYRLSLVHDRKTIHSKTIKIGATPAATANTGRWEIQRAWNRDSEELYAAWIEALFLDAKEGASWPALHEITRNAHANFLHNHLGLQEDDATAKSTVILEPDCADNPFFLRAYFSWKLGLAFGVHEVSRGTLNKPPYTARWITNTARMDHPNPVRAFNQFIRELMNYIHSSTARTRLEDETSDYYPLALTRTALRPGAVFADPYGHTLILVRWIPQQSEDQPGVLLAVDAQPDGTVAIKRFWKGNFLFTTQEVIGEPGFKAFRPIVVRQGKLRLLTNQEIAAASGYGDFSLQQKQMSSDAFYETMDRLINPQGLDPESALLDLLKALHEQLLTRVESVANGEAYMRAHPGVVITMPAGSAAVFQSGGLWEDYSTPNRDLRLLIAIDALLDFPARVARRPENFRLSRWKSLTKAQAELQRLLQKKANELSITYQRSDGTEQRLTLTEILKRKTALEMGYNPNDCVENRWGAPSGSQEIKTCRRRAPAGQQEKMRSLRHWFQKRLHPPT